MLRYGTQIFYLKMEKYRSLQFGTEKISTQILRLHCYKINIASPEGSSSYQKPYLQKLSKIVSE